mgnify:CR=1 FL=1
MKRIAKGGIAAVAAVGIAGGIVAGTASGSSSPERYYDVTVENLTTGQPLSPPLIAEHNRHADFWSVGDIANHAVAAIAEDANNAPAISVLGKVRGVGVVQTGVDEGASAPAPIGPGASQTYRVKAEPWQRLTLLAMLVNTNDGFTGLDSVRIGRNHRSVETAAYDAGSEANNQLKSHIPGPCCGMPFVRDPEGNLISMHAGIQSGVGELDPAVYGWEGAVAKIQIKRVRERN